MQNRPEGGFAQRPQPIIFLLIKNPDEPRDRTDVTTRVQTSSLSRECRQAAPRLALARFHWVNGDTDAAEAAFQAAVRIEPDDLIANRAVAAFYVGTNRLLEAEPYLQAVAEIAETPMAQLMLASFYARTNRPARAVALLEPLSEDPITAAQANVSGYFYYRRYSLVTNRTPTLHWGQATMFAALALLSASLSLEDRQYPAVVN